MKDELAIRGQNFWLLDTNAKKQLTRIDPSASNQYGDLLANFGAWVGGRADEEACYSDNLPPVLVSYSRDGESINEVQYNTLWQETYQTVFKKGSVGLNYIEKPAPFLITFVMGYLLSQSNVSLHCSVTLTGAVAYVLDSFAPKNVRDSFLSSLVRMDGENLTGGTWVTERHGGSDVGATTTKAQKKGENWLLNGLKWFASNPTGGLALATARPIGAPTGTRGLGLYLVPTVLSDGSLNSMKIRRLKNKLGTRGIATGEIDLTDTVAIEIAEPPSGFKLMMEALLFSRIHNAMSAVGVQRRAFLEVGSYLTSRSAFGASLLSYPMIQDEILDMIVNLEAGWALGLEAVRSFDLLNKDNRDDFAKKSWVRLMTALSKYKTGEDANSAARSAIELIGGNAYTVDYVAERLLRDAQVLTVWEGPANIQALEVLKIVSEDMPGYKTLIMRARCAEERAREELGPSVSVLSSAIRIVEELASYVQTDPSQGPKYARKIMHLLADISAAVLLFEEASADSVLGDYRKTLIVRLYIERRLQKYVDLATNSSSNWKESWFKPLFSYESIELTTYDRKIIA